MKKYYVIEVKWKYGDDWEEHRIINTENYDHPQLALNHAMQVFEDCWVYIDLDAKIRLIERTEEVLCEKE